jgi:D-alanyl-D-alanine carboxypeptidase
MSVFAKYLKRAMEVAAEEAQADGSQTIESQHVLLAIVADAESAPARLLRSVGLAERDVRELLRREFEHSLRVAGVAIGNSDRRTTASRRPGAKRLGASVRNAIERGVADVQRGLRPELLLLGILRAELGTVPRAFALAGIDRAALIARVQLSLAETERGGAARSSES